MPGIGGKLRHRTKHAAYAIAERLLGQRRVTITEYPMELTPRYGWNGLPVHPELDRLLANGRDRYAALLDTCTQHLQALRAIPRASGDAAEPRWENSYFSGLDAVVLYDAIVGGRPQTYLEVGSGHSTRFARRAITDAGTDTRIWSIDPAPRAEIDQLCDDVQRCSLTDADMTMLDELVPGDVVLIDGSHMCAMGADTTVAFLETIPRLPAGVLLGVDDIFLPWDYPPTWARRMYGEQYLMATMLLSSQDWEVTFPSWWAAHDPDLRPLVNRFEDPARTRFGLNGSAMWLTRTKAPHNARLPQ